MPAKPVSISFVAEVAEYLRATKKVEVSTEDIADALVAVSKDAKGLERDLNRAMRDSAKDPERLERVVKSLGKEIDDTGDEAKKAGRKMERAFDDAGDAAAEFGDELGNEVRQNLGEGLASGNIEDVVTDTLGGLLSAMKGPIGWATAGVAGVVLGVWQLWRKQAEEEQARQEKAYNTYIDRLIKARGRLSEALSEAAIKDAQVQFISESPEEFHELVSAAKELGISSDLIVRARVGDLEAIREVNKQLDDFVYNHEAANDLTNEQWAATRLVADTLGDANKAMQPLVQAGRDLATMNYSEFIYAMREAAEQSRIAKSNMSDFQDRINSIGMKEINIRYRVTPADTASALWENRIVDDG
jgi:hypothetical protein